MLSQLSEIGNWRSRPLLIASLALEDFLRTHPKNLYARGARQGRWKHPVPVKDVAEIRKMRLVRKMTLQAIAEHF